MAEGHQSLYRRYRPKRFSELKGQDHVARALQNALRDGRVGHAYLFSGPRGTGKTSAARILAKALNCAAPANGEPCCVCESCAAVDSGRLVDWLQEHDAASNNRVEPMRELLERVPLGTSGNRKVIILDEVHMLTGGAANALLKTLEEPPAHVVFVLATTDPQKVLPTIQSRAQHFQFHLLPPDQLAEHVRWVIHDAGLGLGEDAVDYVVGKGGGSARDTLSALDQVAVMGAVVVDEEPVDAVLDALAARDAAAVLAAVAEAVSAGRDMRVLGAALIERLRNAFLAVMGVADRHLPEGERERASALGAQFGTAGITRALEVVGEALVELAKKPDPRIAVEVALLRLVRPEIDRDVDALAERVARLERALAPGGPAPESGAPPSSDGPAAAARAELSRHQQRPQAPAQAADEALSQASAARAGAPGPLDGAGARPGLRPGAGGAGIPSRDELTLAWGDHILEGLPGAARALFRMGRFVEGAGGRARFALPNQPHRDHCEKRRPEVEAALARHFGRAVPLELITDAEVGATSPGSPGGGPGTPAGDEEIIDVNALDDASTAAPGIEQLTRAFPGAELIEE